MHINCSPEKFFIGSHCIVRNVCEKTSAVPRNAANELTKMTIRLSFLGGAGTVTGSKYLVQNGESHILIDCGLFQGLKALRLKNWAPFPIDPRSIDAIVLTHAHFDLYGYLLLLVKSGLPR